MHHELLAQYDSLFKQIDRIRVDSFSRIQERLKRAQYISQLCAEQVSTLNTKIQQIEVREINFFDLISFFRQE